MNKRILSGFLLLDAMGFFACSSYDHPDSNTLITAWSQEAISSSNTANTSSSSAMTSSTLPASSTTASSESISSSIQEASSQASSSAESSSSSLIMTGEVNNKDCIFSSGDSTLTCPEQTYRTIPINGQTWMAENLNVGTQINGASTSVNQADDSKIEKFCYNDDVTLCNTPAGGLYQWAEAMGLSYQCNFNVCASAISAGNHQGICPNGWHIPKIEDWESMYTFTGTGTLHIGKLLAVTGGTYSIWDSKADNSLHLSIWPTGHRTSSEGYTDLGTTTWYATPDGGSGALMMTDYTIFVVSYALDMYNDGHDKTNAEPVRCIKD